MADDTNTPTPDPTILTTDALRREIKASTELTDAKLEALSDAHQAEKLHVEQMNALRDKLAEAKSETVSVRFEEQDKRAAQLAIANNKAIDAALQSQKDAAEKSEINFTKLIDGITKLIASNAETVTAIINDLKDRQSRGEARGGGMKEGWGYLVGLGGLLVGVVIAANAMTGVTQ